MELRVIKMINGISAIEWDSGGCRPVLLLAYRVRQKGTSDWHCRVKIGGERVHICVGSPTGWVESVPIQIIIIVWHIWNWK